MQVPLDRQEVPASQNALQAPLDRQEVPASQNALQAPLDRQEVPASQNALQVPPDGQRVPASRRRAFDSGEESDVDEPSAMQPTNAPTTLPAASAMQTQPLTTRAGRIIRANRHSEYEYSLALMEGPLRKVKHRNADDRGTKAAQDGQHVFSAKTTASSTVAELFFIDRFTGTLFIWNDDYGEYIVYEAVQPNERPIIYNGRGTRIPGDNDILALFETPLSKEDVMPLQEGRFTLPMDQWPAVPSRCYGRSVEWTEENVRRNGRYSRTGKRKPPVVFDEASRKWKVNITPEEVEALFCGGASQVGGREGIAPVDASLFKTPYPPGPLQQSGRSAAAPSISGRTDTTMLHRFISQLPSTPMPQPAPTVTPSVVAEVMASPEALEIQQRASSYRRQRGRHSTKS